MEGLEKREKTIADQLEEARRNAEESQQRLQEYESKLAAAADEVKTLMAGARKDADAAKDRVLTEAKEAAKKERDRAVEDIRLAKETAVSELAQQSVDSAVKLAGRMIKKEVDSKVHSDLINQSLKEFPNRN